MAFSGGIKIKETGRGVNSLGRWEASLLMGYPWFSWETAESYFRIFRTTGELMGSGVEWMGDISSIVIVFLSLSLLLLHFLGKLSNISLGATVYFSLYYNSFLCLGLQSRVLYLALFASIFVFIRMFFDTPLASLLFQSTNHPHTSLETTNTPSIPKMFSFSFSVLFD